MPSKGITDKQTEPSFTNCNIKRRIRQRKRAYRKAPQKTIPIITDLNSDIFAMMLSNSSAYLKESIIP